MNRWQTGCRFNARLGLLLVGLAVFGPGHTFPCLNIDEARQCWIEYQANNDDPDYAQALQHLQRLRAAGEENGGLLALSLAQLSYLTERWDDLLGHARDATFECTKSGNIVCEQQARRFARVAYNQLGLVEEAIWASEKSYELARFLNQHSDQVKAATGLARDRLFGMNNIPRALQVLYEAAPHVEQTDQSSQLFFDHWKGRAALRLGHLDEALLAFRAVAAGARVLGNTELELANTIEALGLEFRLAKTDRGRQHIADELDTLQYAQQHPAVVRILAALTRHGQQPGPTASHDLARCATVAKELGLPEIGVQCEARLAISLAPSNLEEALHWLHTARRSLTQFATPEMTLLIARAELRVIWNSSITESTLTRSRQLLAVINRGRSLQRTGERAREVLGFLNDDHYWVADRILFGIESGLLSKRHRGAALAILETARSAGSAPDTSAQHSMATLKRWISWRSSIQSPNIASAMTRADFELIESNAIQPAAPLTEPPSTAAGLEKLARNEALVFFQWHHNSDFDRRAFIIHRGVTQVLALDSDNTSEQWLSLLDSGVRNADEVRIQSAMKGLSASIAEPLMNALPETAQRLILIPDGQLHGVPLAAMSDIDTRISQAAVFRSITNWASERARPSPPQQLKPNTSVVVFAAPTAPDQPLPGSRLPANQQMLSGTVEEAEQIAQNWPNTQIFTQSSASESAATSQLTSNVQWLHFAAHVKIQPDQPLNSSLQLAPDHQNDGWLTVSEISNLVIPPKVVVLSACESGSGRRLTGEGLLGLTTALLDAGATTVVANLWPIDDALAAAFISRWYQRLQLGETLPEALEKTRREFSNAGYPTSTWAGWTLTGNPGQAQPTSISNLTPSTLRWMLLAAAVGIILITLIIGLRAKRGCENE